MKIHKEEICLYLRKLHEYIQSEMPNSLILDEDFVLSIPPDEWTDYNKWYNERSKSLFAVISLFDDLETLRSMVRDREDSFTCTDLGAILDLLLYVSKKL